MFDFDDEEERIVWLRDPRQFAYLRESIHFTTRRRGPISGRYIEDLAFIVGYAECVPKKGKSGGWRTAYRRRFWWLKVHDRDLDPTGVYACAGPAEAVDPASIAANRQSRGRRMTEEEAARESVLS